MMRWCCILLLFFVVVSVFWADECKSMTMIQRPTNNNYNIIHHNNEVNQNLQRSQPNTDTTTPKTITTTTVMSSSSTLSSRRSFFSISAAIGSSGTVMNAVSRISSVGSSSNTNNNNNVANAAWFWDPQSKETTYAEFVELLKSDQLIQVVFKADGYSLICVDVAGSIRPVKALDNDPTLLMSLYKRKVAVTMEELPPRAMNTVDWFRDLIGDEIDDEEKYKYRGYKTFRMNTQGEIPSSLLTNFSGR